MAQFTIGPIAKAYEGNNISFAKGPKLQGTWMHKDVIMEFARWPSPKFAI